MTKSRALALMTLLTAAVALGVYLYLRREPSLQLSYASATAGTIAREVLINGTLEPATEAVLSTLGFGSESIPVRGRARSAP